MTSEKSPAEVIADRAAELPTKLRRLELPEVLGWALVVGFAVLVVASVIAAILTASVSTSINGQNLASEPVSTVLYTATAWAARPEVVLILLATLGLAWWQVESWSDDADDDEPATDDSGRHVIRASTMATAAGALLVVTAMAAIGLAIGGWSNDNGPGSVTWAFRLEYLGPAVATFLISVAGLFGVYLLRL
jgi:hypothetical protein